MTEELKQTIEREIKELPKEGQEAINAFDWVKITGEIGEKYTLSENELTDFQLETLLVLIGVVDPQFYAINIENHAGATEEKAEQMALEAFQKIFTPIRNILEENIKKNLQTKNPDWQQTLNFILSGGDYTAFAVKSEAPSLNSTDSPETVKTPASSEKSDDIKLKLVI